MLLTATMGLWADAAAAQTKRTDDQIWVSLSGTIPVRRHVELRIDGLLQRVDDASRPGRVLLRSVVLAKIDNQLKVGGGYVWTEFAPTRGVHVTEQRAVQELDYQVPIFGKRLVFASRTQLEERWREGVNGASIRLRQRSRVQAPIGKSRTGVVLWNEYFHELRETEWSGRAGASLMVNFAGLHIPLTDSIAIEPGYLNQTQFEGPNRVRHAAALFASVNF